MPKQWFKETSHVLTLDLPCSVGEVYQVHSLSEGKAILLRLEEVQVFPLQVGELHLDSRVSLRLEESIAVVDGQPVAITNKERNLLQVLCRHLGQVVPSTVLLTEGWGPDYRDDLQYLRVWVSRVRQKLGEEPSEAQSSVSAHRYLQTIRGVGYRLMQYKGGSPPNPPSQELLAAAREAAERNWI